VIEVGEQWENEKCSNFQDKRREEIYVLGVSNGDAEIDDGSGQNEPKDNLGPSVSVSRTKRRKIHTNFAHKSHVFIL
jgi:hypothetical protein